LFWLAVGIILALLMSLALKEPANGLPTLPTVARIGWFVGLAIVVFGALMQWGRQGERLARYSLLVLAIYYGGMWMAHQSALRHAKDPLPDSVYRLAAWPTPANPALWQAAAANDDAAFIRTILLTARGDDWLKQPALDPKFIEALRQSHDGNVFLSFARFYSAGVDETNDGYVITLRDLRFALQLRAVLDHDLNVTSTETRWY
jgi:hypothetical protein